MLWVLLALGLNIVHFLYHQAITWFDFRPFNSAFTFSKKDRIQESITFGLILISPILALIFQIEWMLQGSAILLGTVLMLEYSKWWKPFFGEADDTWRKYHKKHYKDTLMLFKSKKSQPAPNLEHIILHLLSIACLFSLLLVLLFQEP
jgi:hypothetical protein